MTNPAPYFLEEKTIATIDGKRIDTYSPDFVKVLDASVGDIPADCYNSIVRPITEFAGHPAIDDHIANMEIVKAAYAEKVAHLHKNASFGAK